MRPPSAASSTVVRHERPEDPAFEALLEFLKRSRGLDFTGYKRPSLQRRFRRRMETVGCAAFSDYLDYLEVHPDEYAQLFEMLLINVTEFFRDPESWAHLQTAILPELLAAKAPEEPVRVWSAGCAGGQEAYTVAMVFAELLGIEAVPRAREDLRHRRRRGRAQPGADGDLQRQGDRVAPGRSCATATSSAPTSGSPSARTCAAP